VTANPSSRLRRLAPALVLTPALLLGVVACGVPTGEDTFSEVPSRDVPLGLNATSTSTTTTTTTTTTTIPDVPATTAATTSTNPIRLEPVEIYFLSRGRLQPVLADLSTPFTADQVTDVLEAGPQEGNALDTLIEPGLIVGTTESEGVLTVDLDEETFREIASFDQSEAIGQILMTMVNSLRGVGQVRFTFDRVPTAVKKGNTLLSREGEALSYDDYAVLLVSFDETDNAPSSTSGSTPTPPPTDG
jgi:hypothetical protein